MTCYHPIKALYKQGSNERPIFVKPSTPVDRYLERGYVKINLGCNQCIGCRSRLARDYAMRMLGEIEYQKSVGVNDFCFLTLTYSDENLPPENLLNIDDVTKFIHRYRKYCQRNRNNKVFKYYVKGEYGSKTQRPHYHLIIVGDNCMPIQGEDFGEVTVHRSGRRNICYNSPVIRKYWLYGINATCPFTAQSSLDASVAYSVGYSAKLDKPKLFYIASGEEKKIDYMPEDLTYDACSEYLGIEFFKKYYKQFLHNGCIGRYKANGKRSVFSIPKTWLDYAKVWFPYDYEQYLNDKIEYFENNKEYLESEQTDIRLYQREYIHLDKFLKRIRPYEQQGSTQYITIDRLTSR